MSRNSEDDPVVARLDAILNVMQNVLIIEGARAGMTRAKVREMVGVADARVGEVWRHLDLDRSSERRGDQL
jgi:hypothetical protein